VRLRIGREDQRALMSALSYLSYSPLLVFTVLLSSKEMMALVGITVIVSTIFPCADSNRRPRQSVI
jgi:hypothetical protein